MASLYPPQLMPLAFNNTLTTRGLCCGMGACSSHTTHRRVELPRHHSHGCRHSRHTTIVTWGVVVPPVAATLPAGVSRLGGWCRLVQYVVVLRHARWPLVSASTLGLGCAAAAGVVVVVPPG